MSTVKTESETDQNVLTEVFSKFISYIQKCTHADEKKSKTAAY